MPEELIPCEFESDDVEMMHRPGYKDNFMIRIETKKQYWSPTGDEIFALLYMWFISEDVEYEDGYGSLMPLFYSFLCQRSREGYETAKKAHDLEGMEQLDFFESAVDEHIDELIEEMKNLRDSVRG